jgi:cation diffusion facilitator family transporter
MRGLDSQNLVEYRLKERYVLTSLLTSASTFSLKLVSAAITNSLTIFTDLLRNGCESFACFLTWLTVHRIVKGRAFAYEYGYGKLESLSSLLVVAVLLVSLVIALISARERFLHPAVVHQVELGFFVALSASGISGLMWRRNYQRAKRAFSPIMESQWHLFRSKTIANVCVVAALSLSTALEAYPWAIYIDPAASLVLCGFLAFSIYNVVSKNAADLLDRALEESLQLMILRELTAFYDEYVAFHGMRSRRSGNNVYIEIFLEFDGNRTMAEVQKVIGAMKTDLECKIPGSQVVIAPAAARVV